MRGAAAEEEEDTKVVDRRAPDPEHGEQEAEERAERGRTPGRGALS